MGAKVEKEFKDQRLKCYRDFSMFKKRYAGFAKTVNAIEKIEKQIADEEKGIVDKYLLGMDDVDQGLLTLCRKKVSDFVAKNPLFKGMSMKTHTRDTKNGNC